MNGLKAVVLVVLILLVVGASASAQGFNMNYRGSGFGFSFGYSEPPMYGPPAYYTAPPVYGYAQPYYPGGSYRGGYSYAPRGQVVIVVQPPVRYAPPVYAGRGYGYRPVDPYLQRALDNYFRPTPRRR